MFPTYTSTHRRRYVYDSDENVAALEINSMNRSPDTNIIWVGPKVNGTPLRVELDTGFSRVRDKRTTV